MCHTGRTVTLLILPTLRAYSQLNRTAPNMLLVTIVRSHPFPRLAAGVRTKHSNTRAVTNLLLRHKLTRLGNRFLLMRMEKPSASYRISAFSHTAGCGLTCRVACPVFANRKHQS
ncbi:hypothetical protein BC826DRAFT_365412 [Russula brevipes]|nr:hypothetical protein BC826DRAFT_365412 [Russula brevipes]